MLARWLATSRRRARVDQLDLAADLATRELIAARYRPGRLTPVSRRWQPAWHRASVD